MKRALAVFMCMATPALAMQHPAPGRNKDPHVCDVPYDPNDIVQIVAARGDLITIMFGKEEIIKDIVTSDSKDHLWFLASGEGGNVAYFKASDDALRAPNPISIRTLKDGKPRDYTLQWNSVTPPPARQPRLAAAGDLRTEELQIPYDSGTPCYVIRYTYGSEVSAAQAAAWRAAAAERKRQVDEIALRQSQLARANWDYVAMGDTQLQPSQIFDDGMTTEMRFPGNMALPIVLVETRERKLAQPSGITIEDGGVVKLHSVEPVIHLVDGDLTLCVFNRRYTQAGNNPGTGTTSDTISREVNTKAR